MSTGSNQVFANESTVYPFIGGGGGPSGDVTGPSSSTNLHVALYNGTDGKTIQNSNVEVKDNRMKINGNELAYNCEHEITVFSAADFPAPVAGVITLLANMTYDIKKTITLSDRLVIPAGTTTLKSCVFSGQTSIIYDGGGNFITSVTTSNVVITGLKFEATSGGTFITTTAGNSLYSITYCIFEGWDVMGTVANAVLFGMNRNIFTSVSRLFLTNCAEITIDTCKFTETSTNDFFRISIVGTSFGNIRSCLFDVTPNNTLFDISSSLTGRIKIVGTTRTNSNGVFFKASGKDQTDPLITCIANDFQADSRVLGSCYSQNETTTIILTQNVWTDLDFQIEPVQLTPSNERFTLADATLGSLEYVGLQDFSGIATLSIFGTSNGSARIFEFRLNIDGTPQVIIAKADIGNNSNGVTVQIPVVLQTGNVIDFQVQNTENNDNLTITSYVLTIR